MTGSFQMGSTFKINNLLLQVEILSFNSWTSTEKGDEKWQSCFTWNDISAYFLPFLQRGTTVTSCLLSWMKSGSTLKGNNMLPGEHIISFNSWTHPRRKANVKMVELFSLKVYPSQFNNDKHQKNNQYICTIKIVSH